MLSSGSGRIGRFFHSFEMGVSVAVVTLVAVDACVLAEVEMDESAGVNVTVISGVCVADGGTSYRGVGISRAGVFVGVGVGTGGVSAWQAAIEMQTSKVKRYL